MLDPKTTIHSIQRARAGDPDAAADLVPMVYDELRRLAQAYFRRERAGHTLQPTALVHEAYLQLASDGEMEWKDRAHFLGMSARAMRRVLVHHARRVRAQKRGGDRVKVTLAETPSAPVGPALDVLVVDEALEELEALDERKARVVELRFFAGLTQDESAHVLGVSPKTVESDWYMARAWLRGRLRDDGGEAEAAPSDGPSPDHP